MSGKFTRDVVWNVASLAVAGVAGVALNALIGLVYDVVALGVFNQVFAGYIFFSQIAALGVHHSALTEIASSSERKEQARAASSALTVAAAIGAIVALGFWLAAPFLAELLDSPKVGTGMRWATPAVVLFALSKTTLACANAIRRMRWYAVLVASRVVAMLIAFAGCVVIDADSSVLPVVLTIAEAVTFLASLVAIRGLVTWMPFVELAQRARRHLAFGIKGVMSGVVAELNTRIDVLMLGYFTTDAVVGIYSFAAILAEGMFQLLVVLRTNYAPIIARLWADQERFKLLAMIRRGRNRAYLAALPIAAVAVAAYTWIFPLLITTPMVTEGAQYFAVLVAGMFAVAGYVPFSQVLLQARFPGWHTWLMIVTAAINAIANIALITTVGPVGAAAATALSFVAMIVVLRTMSRILLDLPI